MNNLAQTLLRNWHLTRVIYLVIAGLLLAQAWTTRELPFALVGGLFLYQSLMNTGCCGMNGNTKYDLNEDTKKSLRDTEYTEIK